MNGGGQGKRRRPRKDGDGVVRDLIKEEVIDKKMGVVLEEDLLDVHQNMKEKINSQNITFKKILYIRKT